MGSHWYCTSHPERYTSVEVKKDVKALDLPVDPHSCSYILYGWLKEWHQRDRRLEWVSPAGCVGSASGMGWEARSSGIGSAAPPHRGRQKSWFQVRMFQTHPSERRQTTGRPRTCWRDNSVGLSGNILGLSQMSQAAALTTNLGEAAMYQQYIERYW